LTWLEVQITTTNEAEEAVTQAFYDAGADGVAIEAQRDVRAVWDDPTVNLVDESLFEGPSDVSVIRGYFPDGDKAEAKIREILMKIAKLPAFGLDPGSGELQVQEIEEEDWANSWKKYFVPTRVSRDMTVVPSWENYEPEEDETVIDMDPGMAFGTGTHETTKLCVQAIEDYLRPHDTVIDVGCGTGILSIAAAKHGAGRVIGVDLDPVAVKSAGDNSAKNHTDDIIELREGNLLDTVESDVRADLVVANILAQAVVSLTPDVTRIIHDGGIFISSGIISQFLDDVLQALEENGFDIIEKRQLGEWHAVIAKKR
jgi:ribosomal protein L11 methyltransferase